MPDNDPTQTRVTKGRRLEDRHRNIEVHPIAISVAGGVITILLMIAGYFFKGWADSLMTEIRLLRTAAERQLAESATNTEWRDSMGKWRDDTEKRVRALESTPPTRHYLRQHYTEGGAK